jgi:hypothetical protein
MVSILILCSLLNFKKSIGKSIKKESLKRKALKINSHGTWHGIHKMKRSWSPDMNYPFKFVGFCSCWINQHCLSVFLILSFPFSFFSFSCYFLSLSFLPPPTWIISNPPTCWKTWMNYPMTYSDLAYSNVLLLRNN